MTKKIIYHWITMWKSLVKWAEKHQAGPHSYCQQFNSLVPGWCGWNFKSVISKHMLWIKFMSTCCEIVFRWMPQNTFDDKSALVKGLSPVTRNLCCQSARGNRSGAVRYFPEAVRPRGNTAAPDRFPRADWQHKFLVTGLNPDYNMVTVRV